MNGPRKVLVISYLFPPTGNVGVHRTLRFVKWLPSFGWQPVVLTARNAKVSSLEPSLQQKVSEDLPVYRSYSFEALNNGQPIDRNDDRQQRSLLSRLIRKTPTDIWRFVAAPDEKVGWVPFAKRVGAEIIKRHKIDAIYVTGKPFSSFLIGESLSRRFGIPWLMDLRDLWTLNRRDQPKNWWHRWLGPRLERRLMRNASIVIANTPGNRQDFVENCPDCPPGKFIDITNGYDRDDFVGLPDTKSDKFTIAYTGAFYFRRATLRGRKLYATYSPKSMFQAIKELFDENAEMRSQTQLLFTGSGCDKIAGLVSEFGLTDNVKLLGWVSYRESLETLRMSHLLALMLSSGVESAGWIPSKLFQYMASGTPILGLVPEGDVAQIIRETNTGTVIGPNDVEEIKTVIRAAYSAFRRGETHAEPNWNAVENYEGCRLTERLADCLQDVVASSRVPADRSPQSLIGR